MKVNDDDNVIQNEFECVFDISAVPRNQTGNQTPQGYPVGVLNQLFT